MPKPGTKPPKPLSRDELVHLVGDLDEAVLMEILKTDATYVEIEEAVKAAVGNADDLGRLRRTLGPRAEAVFDILTSDPTFLGNNGERER